jgi:flagellar motility protein MotE (MotC chaperone)
MRIAIPQLRLLPVAIVAMATLLSLKVAEFAGLTPGRALPQAAQLLPSVVSQAQAADPPTPPSPASMNRGMGHASTPPPASTLLPQGEPITAITPEPSISPAERALLEDLRARRQALDTREANIVARETMLAAAERRLTQRVDELSAMQTRLEALDRAAREREDANWRNLVRIYENMRPRDAAKIFDELDMPVLLEVVARMKERSVAPILAGMQPERSRQVTSELAARRARPAEGG